LCNARPKGWSSPDLRDYGPVPDLPVVRLGDIPAPASEVDDTRAPIEEDISPTPPMIEVDDTRAPIEEDISPTPPMIEVDDTRAPTIEGDGPTPPIEVDDTRAPND
jgi:hypothetical protein